MIATLTILIRCKPSRINAFYIHQEALYYTKLYLTYYYLNGCEGLVFWSGIMLQDNEARITNVLSPEIEANSAGAVITERGLEDLYNCLRKNDEFLFAQIHSHPGSAFHSYIDESGMISYKIGFLSVVVPCYGQVSLCDLTYCKVLEYKGGKCWHHIKGDELRERFIIIND